MIQAAFIRGASVRMGTKRGVIERVHLPWVRIRWQDGTETVHRRGEAAIMDSAEVFTLNGWKRMGDLIGSKSYLRAREGKSVNTLEWLENRYSELLEASPHNPFRRKSTLGPANVKKYAQGGVPKGTRTVPRTNYWSCRCANYKCKCKGKNGENKTVVIDKSYKGRYNVAYARWIARLQKKTGRRHPTVNKAGKRARKGQ